MGIGEGEQMDSICVICELFGRYKKIMRKFNSALGQVLYERIYSH